MTKTITLRIPGERYQAFQRYAVREERPLSNFIERAAWIHLQECLEMDEAEENEILGNKNLMKKIYRGFREAKKMRGSFVD